MNTTFTEPAKKHLGQNFLHERGVIDKIVQAVDPQPGDAIVEIGPGQGALTFPLLRKHGALTAIEFDRDLHAPLQAAARAHGTLRLIEGDVLGVDFTALAAEMAPAGGQIRLVGNLPYNLSSPILFHALDHAAAVRDMHFMLQKEVVERMAAGPGSKVYGRLSVMLQAYCAVTPLFIVPPGAFRPAPKVDSAVCVARQNSRISPRICSAVTAPLPKCSPFTALQPNEDGGMTAQSMLASSGRAVRKVCTNLGGTSDDSRECESDIGAVDVLRS